jgi:soluble lytic murein transglycosylase-like protein
MSIEQQLIGRYTNLVDKAQTLPEMLAAQQHLTTAIQDGTLQPYAGIPLVQSLTGSIKQKQAEAQSQMLQQYAPQVVPQQQGQAPAPIASQVMAQAAGLDNLKSNLPAEEGYAQGGVIAFAGTGSSLVGDDEEDDDENDYGSLSKQEEALLAQYMAGIEDTPEMPEGEMPQGREPQRGIASMGVQASPVGIDETKKGASEGIQYTAKKHKYEAEIRNAARKAGIPEDLFLHMMAKETGGLSNPESARSKAGALGIAQFMPATAKQYGIDPLDINQALPAAAKMTASLLKKYDGNERLAAMAYNWGQGNVDKWLATGADPAKLPKETAGYTRAAEGGIMRLAAGGTVAFSGKNGNSKVEEDDQTSKDREDFILGAKKLGSAAADVVTLPVRGVMGALNTGIRGVRAAGLNVPYIPEEAFGGSSSSLTPYYDRYIRANEAKPAEAAPAGPQGLTMKEMLEGSGTPETSGMGREGDMERMAAEKVNAKSNEELASFNDMIKERAQSAKNQKEIDAYMSILQAGLGMMGGTSPYAFANIGQGGMHGVNTAMAARKSQIAEENAIMSGRLGLSRAELLEKSRQNALDRQLKNDILLAGHRKEQIQLGQQRLGVQAQTNLLKARKQFVDEGGPEKLNKKFAEKYGKNWNVDPKLQMLYNQMERQELMGLTQMGASEEGVPSAGNL